MTQQTNETLDPVSVSTGEGEAWWWVGCLAEIKATAADTGGLMTIVEVTDPPGAEAPLHVHHREDEAFWVLDGEVTFEVGGRTLEAGPGDFLFGPRDLPHRYRVGERGARMLFILTPGGFEELIRGMGVPARRRTLPPADEPGPDPERMMAASAAAGCEILA